MGKKQDKVEVQEKLSLQAFKMLQEELNFDEQALKQILELKVDRKLKANLVVTVMVGG